MSNIIWSISRIGAWLECPLKAKYKYIDKLYVEMPSEALEKGKKLHDYYDKFYDFYEEDIYDAEEKAINYLGIDEEFQKKYMMHALNFREFVILNDVIPHKRESKYYATDIDGDKWIGIIDRVDKIDEEFVKIIDYKTSEGSLNEVSKNKRIMKADGSLFIETSNYLPQLLLYAKIYELAEKEKVKEVGILFTSNQKELSSKEITQEEIDKNWEEMVEKKRQAKEAMKGPYEPKLGKYCFWCEYKDKCPLKVGFK